MRGLVLQYYLILRLIVRTQPDLRPCLKRCRHCRIFFLTDRRNAWRKDGGEAGRRDLGCPFGCPEAHGQEQSKRRSVAYYQTEEGKKKKQRLNQRRRESGMGSAPGEVATAVWPEPLVVHVQGVVSLIERRPVSREEILEVLAKVLRQQGLGRRRKIDHAVAWLNENPP